MNQDARLQYLQALGIDVWVRRESSHEAVKNLRTASDDPATAAEEKTQTHVSSDEEWNRLERQVAACRACSLCDSRTQTVFGSGHRQAQWMLIGEAPGQSEDLEGLPFVGRAGQLLTEMIRALGMSRDQVYIANVLKCRPPQNRDPKEEEVRACLGYLRQQISWVQPKIILAVGRIAAQNLLNSHEPLARLRGVVHRLDGIPLIVIYHPAYLLRSPKEKRKAWQDLQFALNTFEKRNA